MKQIKVSEATPIQLDWLVAKAQGIPVYFEGRLWDSYPNESQYPFEPSTDPTLAYPIIERERITLRPNGATWVAYAKGKLVDIVYPMEGPTLLIAAMRCYVASKMGDIVEIPEELT